MTRLLKSANVETANEINPLIAALASANVSKSLPAKIRETTPRRRGRKEMYHFGELKRGHAFFIPQLREDRTVTMLQQSLSGSIAAWRKRTVGGDRRKLATRQAILDGIEGVWVIRVA